MKPRVRKSGQITLGLITLGQMRLQTGIRYVLDVEAPEGILHGCSLSVVDDVNGQVIVSDLQFDCRIPCPVRSDVLDFLSMHAALEGRFVPRFTPTEQVQPGDDVEFTLVVGPFMTTVYWAASEFVGYFSYDRTLISEVVEE